MPSCSGPSLDPSRPAPAMCDTSGQVAKLLHELQGSCTPPSKSRRLSEEGTASKAAATKPAAQVPVLMAEKDFQPAKPLVLWEQATASIELLGDSQLWTGPRQGAYAWMDEPLAERVACRDRHLTDIEEELVQAMKDRHPDKDLMAGTVGVPAQAEMILCGRILCEGLEGRLNESSILLEGSRASAFGARVHLNVGQCPKVTVVPGQVVAVLGRSSVSGTTFHARDFIGGLALPLPRPLPVNGSLHIMALAGPYCLRDGLDYTPLENALTRVAVVRPQVLVLFGPFVDANNGKIAAGEPVLPGEQELSSFERVYVRHVLPTLTRCLTPICQGASPTKVLIVPSLEEVLCFHPLPQPPLDAMLGGSPPPAGSPMEQLAKLGVHFLPNPAHVLINGFRVSLTSADALSPLLREMVVRPEGKKIEEALRLLLLQRGLFPVVPRNPAKVCERRAAAFDFPDRVTPDLCIFPSATGVPGRTLIDSTVFLNPGVLCRPASVGGFAELRLLPHGGDQASATIEGRVRVQVHKLS